MRSKAFSSGKVLSVSFAHLVHDTYSSFLAPLLPLLIDKFGITYGMTGILTMFQRLPSLLNPLVGILADRLRARFLVILSPAITCLAMSLLGVAPSYTVLAVLLLVMGISSSLFHVPAPVMIRKVSGKQIGKGMSFYMIGGELARTLGPLIIVGGVSLWGLEGSWKLAPFGILASAIIYLTLRKTRITQSLHKDKQSGFRSFFKTHQQLFLILIAYTFFRAFMKQSLSVLLPTYLTHVRGESFENGGLAYTLFQAAGVIGTFIAGKYSDNIGRKSMLLIISISAPLLFLLFIFSPPEYSFYLIFVLGFFVIAQGPVLLAVVNSVNTDRPAFLNSIYMTISFLIGALAMLIVGFISDIIGLENTMIAAALAALPAIFFIFKLPSGKIHAEMASTDKK